MESKTVKLRYPVEVDGTKYSELSMRRPLVGDLRAAQRSAGGGATADDTEIALFTNLCEVPPALWDKMDLGDYLQVQEAYGGFLSRASTGAQPETSSRTSSTSRSR
ncbi:MAG: phage tail assembly protein [Acidobacteria bacterium]|nr:phage tail assembly protein [Acidobacteriota bacterium]